MRGWGGIVFYFSVSLVSSGQSTTTLTVIIENGHAHQKSEPCRTILCGVAGHGNLRASDTPRGTWPLDSESGRWVCVGQGYQLLTHGTFQCAQRQPKLDPLRRNCRRGCCCRTRICRHPIQTTRLWTITVFKTASVLESMRFSQMLGAFAYYFVSRVPMSGVSSQRLVHDAHVLILDIYGKKTSLCGNCVKIN